VPASRLNSRNALLALAAGAALVGASAPAGASRGPARNAGGPPPGHTGGFGEPTCLVCHQGEPLNAPGGELVLEGLPSVYQPGRVYELTVRLLHPGLRAAGFQLASRVALGERSGAQAGVLSARGAGVAVTADQRLMVSYAHHADAASGLARPGEARWSLRWQAPRRAVGPVAVHLVANAADDDSSPLGDFIYTLEARARAR
jgi:hypothetical protein